MLAAKDLLKLGFTPGPAIGIALKLMPRAHKDLGARIIESDLRAILKEPNAYKEHTHWKMLAEALIDDRRSNRSKRSPASNAGLLRSSRRKPAAVNGE